MKKIFAVISLIGLVAPIAAQALSLKAEKPIILPGPAGKFDFMATDLTQNRILAAHRQSATLEALNLSDQKLLPAVHVGHVQGVAIDEKNHKYFLGNEVEHSIVIIDSKNFSKIAEIHVDGPVDAIAFDSKNQRLYAAQDDGDRLWIIDTNKHKVTGHISIPGVPEVFEYDRLSDAIYLNVKDKDEVVRINPNTEKVDATWPTAPASSPHGLVIDSFRQRLYSAGGNGKLVAFDLKSGQVVASANIAPHVDQIALDLKMDVIYSAGRGLISYTQVTDKGLHPLGEVASPKGAHTLTVDPKSHAVWVCYADDQHSFLRRFRVVK